MIMNIEISPKEYEKYMNWNDGMLYCQLLEIDDKHDWRLPTIEELNYLWDNMKKHFDRQVYWSSTEYVNSDSNHSYFKGFIGGDSYINSKNLMFYIRPIRSIKL